MVMEKLYCLVASRLLGTGKRSWVASFSSQRSTGAAYLRYQRKHVLSEMT